MRVKANDILGTLLAMGDEVQRDNLMRFFKTGKGEYGEGDKFIGIKVPDTRIVVKEAKLRVPLEEIEVLLDSEWHEARLCGFLLLVEEMKAALPKARQMPTVKAERREEIAQFYLQHTEKELFLLDISAYPWHTCDEHHGRLIRDIAPHIIA